MITTTLALVIITTLVFGTFMPVIRNCLFPPNKEGAEDDIDEDQQQVMLTVDNMDNQPDAGANKDAKNFVSANFGGVQRKSGDLQRDTNGNIKSADPQEEEEQRESSHYEEVVHPNDERDVDSDSENSENANKRGCAFYFKKLDKEILRPLCIYKYNYEKMHRQDDYIDLI